MEHTRLTQAQALIQGKWNAEVFTDEADRLAFQAWHAEYTVKCMKRNDKIFSAIMGIGLLVLVALSIVTL